MGIGADFWSFLEDLGGVRGVRIYERTPRYDMTMIYTERAHRYWAFGYLFLAMWRRWMTADWLEGGGM